MLTKALGYMSNALKIIIADDHPLFRQALTLTLSSHFKDVVLFEAQTISELDNALHQQAQNNSQAFDLLLLDLDIPGAQGFNSLINVRNTYPELGVIVISGFEDSDTISKAMSYGAAGFIPKSTAVPEMVVAIEAVLSGELWTPSGYYNSQVGNEPQESKIASLTPKQHKILMMFADGLLNKQIAYELGLSESTIKSHASTIFLKLGVKNRTQAVILLNELQINQSSFSY